MTTCDTCNGTRSIPAGGWEPEDEIDNGHVLCPACEPTKAVVLHTGISTEDMPEGDQARYRWIRERIGDDLEPVRLPHAPGVMMLVGEHGKITGLPLNGMATLIVAHGNGVDISRCTTAQEIQATLGDVIVGPAVLIGDVPGNPRTLGLYPEALNWVQGIVHYGYPPKREG